MASITGVELKPDSCVLAGVRPSRTGLDVLSLHSIAPSEWPDQDLVLADMLRTVRATRRMPRRARVVVWGLPEGASPSDPATLALLRSFTSAGFTIQSVLTPPQALALLAASRPRQKGSAAVAWIALNMHGAAIAIVRGAELLYSRTFDWIYTPGVAGSRAQLLQRYTLVAHLAPELRHGMTEVRGTHGARVDAIVTCGDLPELRSLTMPLIEELDLEVETLDSTQGMRAVGRATEERFAELAPAMRLAIATIFAVPPHGRRPGARSWIPMAAAIALIAGAIAFVNWTGAGVNSTFSTVASRLSETAEPAAPQYSPGAGPVGPFSAPTRSAPSPPSPAPSVPARPSGRQSGPASFGPAQKTTASADKLNARAQPPRPAVPPGVTQKPSPRVGGLVADTSQPAPPAPLKEPLPRVDTILFDRERRLALVDGGILGVGDAVGQRTVVQIERGAVVLREPSGLEVRVPLRAPGGKLER